MTPPIPDRPLLLASLHLAPNAPWFPLAVLAIVLVALSAWAYRFAIPPLPPLARRGLGSLRAIAFVALLLLLAQPVLERSLSGTPRVAVLVDRSASMSLPATGGTRGDAARRAVAEIERAWRGRAAVRVLPFASRLGADTTRIGTRGATAIGDALAALGGSAEGQEVNAVVVVSDGAGNAGEDPVEAARRLGVPVHAVVIGEPGNDRAVSGIEAPSEAQVGRSVPLRVRVTSTEERGTPLTVVLQGEGRTLGRTTLVSPGPGAEVVAEFRATPIRPGLATWTARVETSASEVARGNDARQVAFPVAPGRLGVTLVSGALNWDLTFLRRALAGDSALDVTTWIRSRDGWRTLERGSRGGAAPGSMRGQAVVVLDGIAPGEVSPAFDEGLAAFLRDGGGVLALGGGLPGLARLRAGHFGTALGVAIDPAPTPRLVTPMPSPEARDLLAWDDDPARGERAWRGAAPLGDVVRVAIGGGDRVLVAGVGGAPPLLFARRVGRGQALFVNGSGVWRWSLSGLDDLTDQRGRQLWRRLVRWLAEPVQGEPLRVRPERWVTEGGDAVRLVATLQDAAFRPLSGASLSGEVTGTGPPRRIEFTAGAAGTYVATIDGLPPGRYRASVGAQRAGRTLGRAGTEFAVDSWSLELARVQPDSATLGAMAAASGGRVARAADVGRWTRGIEIGSLVRRSTASLRLWESPWMFAAVVGALAIEWAWRRRRGLP